MKEVDRKIGPFETLSDSEKLQLNGWLETASVEILPDRNVAVRLIETDPSRKVDVTCSQSLGIESTLQISERLTEAGMSVIPHIATKSIIDFNHASHILETLKRMKIKEIFAVGGDRKRPLGKYYKTTQLLDLLSGRGFEKVSVAGYPQGHNSISDEVLFQALKQKERWAKETGTKMNIITQICVSAEDTVSWTEKIRGMGITIPVTIGMPGPVKLETLKNFSVDFGVQNLAVFIRNNMLEAIKIGGLAMARFKPGDLLTELAQKIKPEHNVAGIHFFTFNAVEITKGWIDNALKDL